MPIHAACGQSWGGDRPKHCGSCHRTFSGLETFDIHRDHRGEHGRCLDPATIRDGNGDRRLFDRDGIWRAPEMSAERRASFEARR